MEVILFPDRDRDLIWSRVKKSQPLPTFCQHLHFLENHLKVIIQ